MRTSLGSLSRASLAFLAAACSGKVVVDDTSATATEPDCASICKTIFLACLLATNDCALTCATLDELRTATSCKTAIDDLLTCLEKDPLSSCNVSPACASQKAAFSTCVTPYCTANPQVCSSIGDGSL